MNQMTSITIGLEDQSSEFDGESLFKALSTEIGAELAALLVGGKFYVDDPERAVIIVACSQDSGLLTVIDQNGKKRTFALNRGFLLSDAQCDKIAQIHKLFARDQQQKKLRESRQCDVADLIAALRSAKKSQVPTREMRKRYMTHHVMTSNPEVFARIAEAWIDVSPTKLADVLIKLVPALRRLNRFEDAIALTDFIHDHPNGLTQEEKRILLTTRAASWTDIFKLSGNPEARDEAIRCLNESELIGKSDNVDAVRKRIESIIRFVNC
jgi:hypothetical protein